MLRNTGDPASIPLTSPLLVPPALHLKTPQSAPCSRRTSLPPRPPNPCPAVEYPVALVVVLGAVVVLVVKSFGMIVLGVVRGVECSDVLGQCEEQQTGEATRK